MVHGKPLRATAAHHEVNLYVFVKRVATGSTPQYRIFGCSFRPGVICQIFFNETPLSTGKRIADSWGLVQLLPKSSLERSIVPQILCVAARCDVESTG
jgi:hypothetical protein